MQSPKRSRRSSVVLPHLGQAANLRPLCLLFGSHAPATKACHHFRKLVRCALISTGVHKRAGLTGLDTESAENAFREIDVKDRHPVLADIGAWLDFDLDAIGRADTFTCAAARALVDI